MHDFFHDCNNNNLFRLLYFTLFMKTLSIIKLSLENFYDNYDGFSIVL